MPGRYLCIAGKRVTREMDADVDDRRPCDRIYDPMHRTDRPTASPSRTVRGVFETAAHQEARVEDRPSRPPVGHAAAGVSLRASTVTPGATAPETLDRAALLLRSRRPRAEERAGQPGYEMPRPHDDPPAMEAAPR